MRPDQAANNEHVVFPFGIDYMLKGFDGPNIAGW